MLTFIATWPRMQRMGTFALLLMAALSSAAPLPGDADFDSNAYVTRGALLNETFHALSGDVEGSSASDKDSTIEIMPGEIDRVGLPSLILIHSSVYGPQLQAESGSQVADAGLNKREELIESACRSVYLEYDARNHV